MPRRPPDALVYYLDANIDGPELVKRLRDAGMPCEPHRDHFAPDADDEQWIPEIASRGWIIVTRDFAIKRRPNEREAWSTANATVIMMRGEKLSAEDMSKLLLTAHAYGRLDNYIAKRTRPMILYLNADGQLQTHVGGERRGRPEEGVALGRSAGSCARLGASNRPPSSTGSRRASRARPGSRCEWRCATCPHATANGCCRPRLTGSSARTAEVSVAAQRHMVDFTRAMRLAG